MGTPTARRHATDNEIDGAALGAFSDVCEAIAAFVADAQHLDQLRLRLRQLFDHLTVEDDGATVALVPTLRDDALDAVMADVSGLRREAVRATTYANGLPIAWVISALFRADSSGV